MVTSALGIDLLPPALSSHLRSKSYFAQKEHSLHNALDCQNLGQKGAWMHSSAHDPKRSKPLGGIGAWAPDPIKTSGQTTWHLHVGAAVMGCQASGAR